MFGLPWEYIAPMLTGISVLYLANQNSAWFTRVFGNERLGAFSLCFDWAYVGAGGSSINSMFTPLATQLSLYVNDLHSNSWWLTDFQNFPFLTQLLYYENGTECDQLSILNGSSLVRRLPAAVQGLVHDLHRRRPLHTSCSGMESEYKLIRAGRDGIDDPHFKKMKAYPGETFLHVASCTSSSVRFMSGAPNLLNASLTVMSGAEIATYLFAETSVTERTHPRNRQYS
ncbi:hypothetical protein DFH08DRAFT_976900 [Mycena albidolilacea]|uniref:Uncharacterized protein n=1 Tax=Mycena albidolilacea TaxID=1033008 RepID=A0AAD6Z1W9_9AGAR|nr:hypothetical protein DFH08DRAFT_976900 [Mycena albidolilacea]